MVGRSWSRAGLRRGNAWLREGCGGDAQPAAGAELLLVEPLDPEPLDPDPPVEPVLLAELLLALVDDVAGVELVLDLAGALLLVEPERESVR